MADTVPPDVRNAVIRQMRTQLTEHGAKAVMNLDIASVSVDGHEYDVFLAGDLLPHNILLDTLLSELSTGELIDALAFRVAIATPELTQVADATDALLPNMSDHQLLGLSGRVPELLMRADLFPRVDQACDGWLRTEPDTDASPDGFAELLRQTKEESVLWQSAEPLLDLLARPDLTIWADGQHVDSWLATGIPEENVMQMVGLGDVARVGDFGAGWAGLAKRSRVLWDNLTTSKEATMCVRERIQAGIATQAHERGLNVRADRIRLAPYNQSLGRGPGR
jgi:hypothetical protein